MRDHGSDGTGPGWGDDVSLGMAKWMLMCSIHMGGIYGDKPGTLERFKVNWHRLSDGVKARLVLENDEVNTVHWRIGGLGTRLMGSDLLQCGRPDADQPGAQHTTVGDG